MMHLVLTKHVVANMPAEMAHLFEEIAAKDKVVQDCRNMVADRDGQLQKFIRLNGSLLVNPKEETHNKAIESSYEQAEKVQEEKLALTDKAAVLLDRQLRRLDIKIRDLTRQGVMPKEPALPSILYPSAGDGTPFSGVSTPNTGISTPLNPLPNSGLPGTTIANSNLTRLAQPQPQSARGGARFNLSAPGVHSSLNAPHLTSSAPTTPAANVAHLHQRQRESSAGAGNEVKRRRLNTHLGSLPSASSALAQQSSLGPSGTPKAGTPSSVRSGSAGPKKGQANKGGAGAASQQARRKVGRPGQQQQKQPARGKAQAADGKPTKRPRKKLSGAAASSANNAKSGKGSSFVGVDGASTPGGSSARGSHKNLDVEMRDRGSTRASIEAIKEEDDDDTYQKRIKAENEGGSNTGRSDDEHAAGRRGTPTNRRSGAASKPKVKRKPRARAIAGTTADSTSNPVAAYPAVNEDDNDDNDDDDDDDEDEEEEGEEDEDDDDDAEDEEEEEDDDDDDSDDKKYCICRNVSHGNMVACDNDTCPFEWFHWICVGVNKEPTGTWYCPKCRGASVTELAANKAKGGTAASAAAGAATAAMGGSIGAGAGAA